MSKTFVFWVNWDDAQALKPYLEYGLQDERKEIREASSRISQEISFVKEKDYSPLPGQQIILDRPQDADALRRLLEVVRQ